MSLQLNDRVRETSATTGTVPIVLTGAPLGFQTISSSITSSNTFPYVVELVGGSEWEIGIGIYVSGNNSIIRTQVLNSSNAGSIVNFSSGAKNVFITIPAAYSALTARGLSQFSTTTSAELASIISDETGSGKLVFANNAILITPDIGAANASSLTVSGNVVAGNVYSGGVLVLTSEPIAQSAFLQANAAYTTANTGISIGQSAFVQANTGILVGQSAFAQANTGILVGQSAFAQANTGILVGQSAFVQANTGVTIGQSGFAQANAAYTAGNTGISIGQNAFAQANSEPIGKNAFAQANAAYTAGNTGISVGQSAFAQANAAYNTANTKFSSSGGTISGSVTITTDLNVTGNVYLGGNVTILSSNNLSINDPLIYLAQDNPANLQDIGLVGHFTSDHYQHTGLVRDATDGVWKFFSNVSTEPATTIDFTGNVVYDTLQIGSILAANAIFSIGNGSAPFVVASNTLVANLNSDLLDGQHGAYYSGLSNTAYVQANAAYNQANTGISIGQAGFTQANSAYGQANTGVTIAQAGFNQANSGFSQANAAFTAANTGISIGQTAFTQANAAFTAANTGISVGQGAFAQANTAYGQANTGVTIGQSAFTQANSAFTQANVAYTTANTGVTIGQSAFTQANSAFTQANSAFTQANVAYTTANTGVTIGQNAFSQANTALGLANSAYNKANTGGGGGLLPTSIQTANYVASKNQLVRCNTAVGAFSVSFPDNPIDGDIIGIVDIAETFGFNNLTLLPNTKFIESDSTSYILDINGAYVSFVYNTATTNWRLLETPHTWSSNGSILYSGSPTNISGLLSGDGTTLSGVGLKTINGASIIGSGNITVSTSGGSVGLETNFLLMGA